MIPNMRKNRKCSKPPTKESRDSMPKRFRRSLRLFLHGKWTRSHILWVPNQCSFSVLQQYPSIFTMTAYSALLYSPMLETRFVNPWLSISECRMCRQNIPELHSHQRSPKPPPASPRLPMFVPSGVGRSVQPAKACQGNPSKQRRLSIPWSPYVYGSKLLPIAGWFSY